jgi:hypothetical protein
VATGTHQDWHYEEPGYNAGWIIAIVVALLVLVAIFFLWRGGYFDGAPTQVNIQQPAPTQQTPPPQAPAVPPPSNTTSP